MSESEEQSEQSKVDNYVLRVDPDELAFLKSYWELRDTREVFQWSLRMLYDLSKADEAGWRMALWKAKLDTEQDNVIINRNYRPAFLPLSLFTPSSGDTQPRISVGSLDKNMELTPEQKTQSEIWYSATKEKSHE